MAKKESAEEKLLKIIEASKKAQGPGAGAAALSAPIKHSPRFALSMRQINLLLLLGVIGSVAFLVYEIRNGNTLLQQNVTISVDQKVPKTAVNLLVPQLNSITYYLDKIASRNIFRPFEKTDTPEGLTSGKASLEKKMSKYKLVGVAWLDLPESATVMLEDTATRMTHFLREGDKIEDITVKAIYTDRVVVGYANEEIVIKL